MRTAKVLGTLELRVDAVVLLQLSFDSGNSFNERQLIDRLSIVSDRTIGIDGDGDRSHAQEAECDEAEREDRWCKHQRIHRRPRAEVVAQSHEPDHA